MQMAAAAQRELGDLAAAEIAADAGDRPRKAGGLEQFEVCLETSRGRREPERRAGQTLVRRQVELHHRAGREPSGFVPGDGRPQETGLVDRQARPEPELLVQLEDLADAVEGVLVDERRQ